MVLIFIDESGSVDLTDHVIIIIIMAIFNCYNYDRSRKKNYCQFIFLGYRFR